MGWPRRKAKEVPAAAPERESLRVKIANPNVQYSYKGVKLPDTVLWIFDLGSSQYPKMRVEAAAELSETPDPVGRILLDAVNSVQPAPGVYLDATSEAVTRLKELPRDCLE